MAISIVSNGPETQIPMMFEKGWYLMLNMALIAYSATFIIHFNAFINAVKMFYRRSRTWVHQIHLAQATGPVTCHLCRMSDYFWATNCIFKGYYNHVSYFFSVFGMDFLQAFRFHKAIEGLDCRYQKILKWFNLFYFGFCVLLSKLLNGIFDVYMLESFTDVATFCGVAFLTSEFNSILIIDLVSHFSSIPFTFFLIYLHYKQYRRKNPDAKLSLTNPLRFINQIGLDTGIFFIFFGDIIIIIMFGILLFNWNGAWSPEIFYQVRWALHTKCISVMMEYWTEKEDEKKARMIQEGSYTHKDSSNNWNSKDKLSTLCNSQDAQSIDLADKKGRDGNMSQEFIELA
ncbi:hypothetical protein CONCODRAFT_68773 [Conidiobolus coronatus NRRL 28638]|uniref:Uncharacterized protein n=1 Tax=Conidiobolus coronatus (strain ATCC 28846 / CBS 209.66 / NRRL 28638) TaxID=796925 RepID=A0A137PCN6_CONC2|nr:hypothetical protein CONCODRAFT_68773 [Conidiobolus coronatus NRRL 28638]|eukprot:KXN72768.1 hypothetical protein CONCODRAFT_68773 [Conidiobolus coronatus NRRL 28638]